MSQPTGSGALGLTYREIAPSATAANVGNPADNEVLTFTMACSPSVQNYLTIQVWGSDTILNVIYLYTPEQGYLVSNYYSTSQPEIDFQKYNTPVLPGRFVYETIAIPMAMTQGNSTVTLTLNAAQAYNYYLDPSTATTDLPAGATSRPIYAAFTPTDPYLTVAATDPQGSAPSAAAATPATYNSAYFSAIQKSMTSYLNMEEKYQVYGSSWTAAVNAGTVPVQIIGYFDTYKHPTDSYTTAQWLNNAAVDTSVSNNAPMNRLDSLAYAYATPNLLSSFYQNSTTEQAIVAALDAYSYMQSLNGCWGGMTAWAGVGATSASSSNPYGRTNAPCSVLEGAGTWSLGSTITLMQNDSSFLAALNQPISSSLEPGVLRYQAYQTMLVNHINFLTSASGHGHSPNTDQLQAIAYVYANLALRALDKIYGTSLAQSNAAMYSNYLNVVAGLTTNQYGGVWVSDGGLSLEFHGTGNGSYDGSYGWDGANYLVKLAKILNDNGIETSSSHPVRDVALNTVHAFSNFIYPSLTTSGSGYANTLREEETLTFRKNLNLGEINAGTFYIASAEFNDPYAIHAFYLEQANGIIQSMEATGAWNNMPAFGDNGDGTVDNYLRWYTDYVTMCNMVNSESDLSGVTFLNETAHGNGVWADPTGSTITIQNNGEKLAMVLNWRPLMWHSSGIPSASKECVNNLARVHDTTATMDRIANVEMPASAATGASGNYTSGSFGTLYVARYGSYLVGLNWQSNAATMTLPPDMQTSGDIATDLVSGTTYNLATTTSVSVPAGGAVALFQYLPTSTLSASSVAFSSTVVASSSAGQTVTLQNSGTGPLLIGTTNIMGTNASDFTYATTCSATLAVNASCGFTFTFKPQSTGARSATFNLKTSANSTAQTIALTGTGAAAVNQSLTLTPAPDNVSLQAGSSTTVQLALTPGDGLAGTVALSCSSPQSFITCSLPSTATVGSSPSNVTVSIAVTSALAHSQGAQSKSSFIQQAGLSMLSGGLAFLFFRRPRRPAVCVVLALGTFISFVVINGCGSGARNGSAPTLPPTGTYTLTLSGSSRLVQPSTTTVSVMVTS
ncbi:choice-of-anchor D domain-containing protein [Granulicella arctica]|nr:choice-of-anchor D domain-containing protein [Granulicella arctica]